MPEDVVSPQNLSDLINHLMKTKDPAVVGLRRILKKKAEEGRDFPLKEHTLEEFCSKDSPAGVFNETEKRMIALEKETLELKNRLAEQKKKAEQAIAEAYKKGMDEGIRQGEKSGEAAAQEDYNQQLKKIEGHLTTLFNEIVRSRRSLFLEAHRTVLDLCILMVRKIIDTELSLNPEIVLSVIKKALTFIADRQEFIVRVAPDDLETVTKKRDFWTSISDRLNTISIEKDERIEKGGCIIESNTGVTDARIPVQIGELIEIIDTTWDNLVTAGGSHTDTETDIPSDDTVVADDNSDPPILPPDSDEKSE